MTTLALSAASTFISDAQLNAGAVVPSGTSIAANTVVTLPWAQGVCLYALGATSNTITLTFSAGPNGVAVTTGSLTAATSYYFGPIGNGFASTAGLVTVTITGTVTGAKFAAVLMPGQTGNSHNPFELNPQATDY